MAFLGMRTQSIQGKVLKQVKTIKKTITGEDSAQMMRNNLIDSITDYFIDVNLINKLIMSCIN